jgi:hypothetical protein
MEVLHLQGETKLNICEKIVLILIVNFLYIVVAFSVQIFKYKVSYDWLFFPCHIRAEHCSAMVGTSVSLDTPCSILGQHTGYPD